MKYKNNKWKKIKICELGKIITGKTPKTSIKDNYNGNILFLTPSDNMNLKKVSKTKRTLTKKGVNSVKNCLLPPNSICVSCIGSDLGKVIITTKNTVTNQQINSIIPNQNYDNNYIYYMMCILGKKLNYLSKTSTAVPIINKRNFSSYEIYVPELIQQRKIAKILNCIDDKIDLNNKINKNLQSISKLLFKHLFVDFEFPNEDGKPYKSSGGEMVDSELGKIPKGWKVKQLNQYRKLGTLKMGQSPNGSSYNQNKIGIPLINGAADIKNGNLVPNKYTTEPKKISKKNDLIFCIRATIGLLTISDGEYCLGRGVACITGIEDIYYEYMYQIIDNSFKKFNKTASGSVYINLSKDDFNKMNIIIPNYSILNKYHLICRPLLKLIAFNKKQVSQLSSLRDTILPKLMNGEIDVSNIDLNE